MRAYRIVNGEVVYHFNYEQYLEEMANYHSQVEPLTPEQYAKYY